LYLNGVQIISVGQPPNYLGHWAVLIFHTGATTGEFAGLIPYYNAAEPLLWTTPAGGALSGLSWASAQTLEVEFSGSGSTAIGDDFLVEAVD
jgi:hypothetical protein